MSSKISVIEIVKNHFSTYEDSGGHRSRLDWEVMVVVPFLAAVIFPLFNIGTTVSAYTNVVTVGAIFTGLLLNLLVLIYDQKTKLLAQNLKSGDEGYDFYETRKRVIDEVHYNISYSILLSLLSVVIATVASLDIKASFAIPGTVWTFRIEQWLFNFPLVFLLGHLVLTLLMILKRVYKLIASH